MAPSPARPQCEIADVLGRFGFYRRFFGLAGGQLGRQRDAHLQAALGRVDFPLGVIAGDRTLYPISWALIPGPNDGRVSVARQTLAFLREGRFLPL